MEDELPAAGRRVDRLLETAEADPLRLQVGDRLDQVPQRASEAIQTPDDESIAGAQVTERLIEARPVGFGAAGFVLVDHPAAGRPEGVELEFQILVLG